MIESQLNPTQDILTELNIMEPEEIAEALRKEGIKGYERIPNSCPLALFLNKKTGLQHHVFKNFVSVYGDERLGSLNLPISVEKFVNKYDAGKYLFLDAERPTE